jgi:hypothetical protein
MRTDRIIWAKYSEPRINDFLSKFQKIQKDKIFQPFENIRMTNSFCALSSPEFEKNIIKELDLIVYPTGRKWHTTHICLYFENVPVHNKRTVTQTMAECDFRRFDRPVYSPDLASCDLFHFDYLYEKIAWFM